VVEAARASANDSDDGGSGAPGDRQGEAGRVSIIDGRRGWAREGEQLASKGAQGTTTASGKRNTRGDEKKRLR
jgi:hypothetical protein